MEITTTSDPGRLLPADTRDHSEDLGDADARMAAAAAALAETDPPFTPRTAARLAGLLSAAQPRATTPHGPQPADTAA